MNIVYSSSDSFCEIAGISILSLLDNNRDAETIRIFMIDNHISETNKARLSGVARRFGRQIIFLDIPDIEGRSGVKINVGRWNISTFYRLFLPSILPDSVERALFIDCDTLILQSLSGLWNTDMAGAWVMGVDDFRSAKYRTELGLSPSDNYINNGVLLMDLKALRENNAEALFLQFINSRRGDITYVDQGVQNGVLSLRRRSGVLPPKYNSLTAFFDFSHASLVKLRRPPDAGDPAQYLEAVEHPVIVHFQSCFRSGKRPWNPGCTHPFAPRYLAYKADTPWKDEPLREDDRSPAQKALTLIAGVLPEEAMVGLISWMHTGVYPLARGLKKRVAGLIRPKRAP